MNAWAVGPCRSLAAGGQPAAGEVWVVKSSLPWLSVMTAVTETCSFAGMVAMARAPVRISSVPSACWTYQSMFATAPSASVEAEASRESRSSSRVRVKVPVRRRAGPARPPDPGCSGCP